MPTSLDDEIERRRIIAELEKETGGVSTLLAPQPDPGTFNTVTGEVLPPAQQNTIDPNDPAYVQNLRDRGWTVEPQTSIPPNYATPARRAQLVRTASGTAVAPSSMPDRSVLDRAARIGRATQPSWLNTSEDPDPDPIIADQVRRAQLINVPRGTAARAQLVDPDPDFLYTDQGADQSVKKKPLEQPATSPQPGQPTPSPPPAGGTQADQATSASDTIDPDTFGTAPRAPAGGRAIPIPNAKPGEGKAIPIPGAKPGEGRPEPAVLDSDTIDPNTFGQTQPVGRTGYASLGDAAISNVGHLNTSGEAGTQGGALACAVAVTRIVHDQLGINLKPTASTDEMYDNLRAGGWQEVNPNTPGAIIISPTAGGQHGHVGIVGSDGRVYSNSSRTGNWEGNYTPQSWTSYFSGQKGLEVHAFVPQEGGGAPPGNSLPEIRNQYTLELQDDPSLRQRLIASARAEVGSQGNEAILAYLESVMNRAAARNLSLEETISDTSYYDPRTIKQLGSGVSKDEYASYDSLINHALQGSNISNYATGNGGGKNLTFTSGGERFVLEDADAGWNQNLIGAKARPGGDQGFTLQDTDSAQYAELLKADQASQAKQTAILQALPEHGQSYKALVDRLKKPVEGVNPVLQQMYLGNTRQEITKAAQDYYGEKDPDKAYARATSDPDLGTVIGEIMSKWQPHLAKVATQAGLTLQDLTDQGGAGGYNRLAGLALQLHPHASREEQNTFVNDLVNTPKDHLADVLGQYAEEVNKMAGGAPGANLGMVNIPNLMDAVAGQQPENKARFQAQRGKLSAELDIENRNMRTDPRIANTPWQFWTQLGGAAPAVLVQVMTGGTGEALMLSSIFQDAKEDIRRNQPDLSENDVTGQAAASTLLQAVPALGTLRLFHGGLSMINEKIAQLPFWRRLGAGAAVEAGTAGTLGAAQQVAKNIAEGRPLLEGVDQSVLGNLVMGGAFGAVRGIRGRPTPIAPERPAAEPRVEPVPPAEVPETEPRVEPPPADKPMPPADEERRKPPVTEPEVPVREAEVDDNENARIDQEINRDNERNYEKEREIPVEEEPKPVKVEPSEPKQPEPGREPERIIEEEPLVGREVERPVQDVRGDVGEKLHDVGREPPGGRVDVPPELGRVPRPVEAGLSAEERAAHQSLVDEIAKHDPGSAESIAASSKLLEAVYKKFEPIFKAAGMERKDTQAFHEDEHIASAQMLDENGNLRLNLNHERIESAMRRVMDEGNNPADYIHNVLDEELTHGVAYIASRKRWLREKAAGKTTKGFFEFHLDENREMLDNLFRARNAAQRKGNQALVDEINNAVHNSVRVYRHMMPEEAEAYVQHHYNLAKEGAKPGSKNKQWESRRRLNSVANELYRQMHQIRHGDWVESSWRAAYKKAVGWFKDAIDSLKTLYDRLGPGQALARTQLAKMMRQLEREKTALQKRAAKAVSGKAATADISEAIARIETAKQLIQETPKIPEKTKEDLGLAWKKWRSFWKGGEDSMLDNPETHPLAAKIKRRASTEQRIGSDVGIHDFYRAHDALMPKWNPLRDPLGIRHRGVSEGRLSGMPKDYMDYMRARETGQPLPAVSPEVNRAIQAWDTFSNKMGGEMERLNMKVMGVDGKIRPFNRLGYQKHWPRMMTDNFRDIVDRRNTTRKADYHQLLNDMIRRGDVANEADFLDKYGRLRRDDQSGNDHFSNMDRARQLKMPLEHTDFSIAAALKYASRGVKHLAQVESYGQKLTPNHKNAYDRAMDDVEKSNNMSDKEKQVLFQKITELRNAEYNPSRQGHVMGAVNDLQTGLLLGNWGTSLGNLIGGGAHNLAQGGPKAFFKAVGDMPKWSKLRKEAEAAGITKGNFADVMNNLDLVRNQNWATKGIRGFTHKMLKWGGQHLTEDVNRVMSMQVGKHWLDEFAKVYNDNTARSRFMKEQATRLGIKRSQLDDLASEGGTGTLSEEFLRNWVMQTHGSYDPAQATPGIFNHPVGRIMGKFGQWGANASRFMAREYVMPFSRSVAELKRNPGSKQAQSDFLYHFGRSVGFMGVALGSGQLAMWGRNLMLNRDSRDPKYTEILKRFQEGDTGVALGEFFKKSFDNIVLSSMFGSVGDAADLIQGWSQGNLTSKTHNPAHPPMYSMIESVLNLGSAVAGEHEFSPKAVDSFLSNISSQYRTGMGYAKTIANRAQIPFPWDLANQTKADNDISFLKQRVQQYEQENPVIQQKRAAGLGRAPQFGATPQQRNVASATKDDIHAALVTGNSKRAIQVLNDYIQNQPPALRDTITKSFKSYIQTQNPLQPGGSGSASEMSDFLSWAKSKLPEADARQIFASATTYAKAAMTTNLFSNKSGLAWLAGQDYDKFHPAAAKAASARSAARLQQSFQRAVQRNQAAAALTTGR